MTHLLLYSHVANTNVGLLYNILIRVFMKFKPIYLSTVSINGLLIKPNSLSHSHFTTTNSDNTSDNIIQYQRVVNVNQSESKIDNRFEVSNLF